MKIHKALKHTDSNTDTKKTYTNKDTLIHTQTYTHAHLLHRHTQANTDTHRRTHKIIIRIQISD